MINQIKNLYQKMMTVLHVSDAQCRETKYKVADAAARNTSEGEETEPQSGGHVFGLINRFG